MRKIVKIWDFDGVLFRNPEKDYSDQFLVKAKKDQIAEIPKSYINVLFTGRPLRQRDFIVLLLNLRGIQMDYMVFSPFTDKEFTLNKHQNVYEWKLQTMHDKFYVLYPDFERYFIDDEQKIIQLMQEHQIEAHLIHVPKWKKEWTDFDLGIKEE